MTSQISLSKLMKVDIKTRGWMIVLSSVVQIILGPVIGLFMLTTKVYRSFETAIPQIYEIEYTMFGPLIGTVGAILLALVGFRYLFSKRMMDLYGSVPVSRNKLFLANYINSIIIYVVPFICSVALTAIACIACDSSLAGKILIMSAKELIAGILTFLVVYHMCLVAVMLSGHPFVAITNIVLMGLVVMAGYLLFVGNSAIYFATFLEVNIPAMGLAWLSPLTVPFFASAYIFDGMRNITTAQMVIFGIGSAVLCIANLVLAVYLFNKRKSELAEGGVTNRLFIIIIRSVSAIVIGMYGALMFTIMGSRAGVVWGIIGVIIGVVASFGIINMILHRAGRAFFKDKFVMIGTLVFTILLSLVFSVDLLHYDTYLPSKESIASANIYFNDYNDDGMRFDIIDGELNEDFYANFKGLERYSTDDADLIYKVLKYGTEYASTEVKEAYSLFDAVFQGEYYGSKPDYTVMQVKVKLKNGVTYGREYKINIEHLADIEEIINTNEYRETMYPISTGNVPMPKSISFTRMASDVYEDWRFEDPELIEMIMECYRRDFSENPVPISWGYENSLECEYHVYDEGGYSYYDAEDGMGMYHRSYASMPICDTYVRMNVIQIIIDETDYERLLYDNKSVVEYMKEQVQEILDVH